MLCAPQSELDMPPEEGKKWGLIDYLTCLSPHRMKAVIWKDFLWMWRNVPWVFSLWKFSTDIQHKHKVKRAAGLVKTFVSFFEYTLLFWNVTDWNMANTAAACIHEISPSVTIIYSMDQEATFWVHSQCIEFSYIEVVV
jgi:hypothetical protein